MTMEKTDLIIEHLIRNEYGITILEILMARLFVLNSEERDLLMEIRNVALNVIKEKYPNMNNIEKILSKIDDKNISYKN